MTDDLVKRLRGAAETMRRMKAASLEASELDEAAAKLEQLQAENERLREMLNSV